MSALEPLARAVEEIEKRGIPHPSVLFDSALELIDSIVLELQDRPGLAKELALKLAATALLLAKHAEQRAERLGGGRSVRNKQ